MREAIGVQASAREAISVQASAREAIRVQALTRRFGEFTAVDGVTFDVPAGAVFGFLGPNGAGKTTTLKMLTGLLRPTSGTGTVAGVDIGGDTRALKQRIGYMSQSFSLYADLTVGENIELFAGLYGVAGARLRDRRAWVLEMAGLTGREHQLTASLPLGWKQRLALGCAVLHEPPILFLDEPTSGVDPIARRAFWDLIHAQAAAGTTVLVSTHYMEEAEYCNRLILMNRGCVIAEGAPSALRATFAQPIREIEVDDPARTVDVLQRAPGIVDATMIGRTVHVVADADIADERIAARLDAEGIRIRAMRPARPSLEDIFVSLVRGGGAVAG